jgi:type IX secretion system PorP/SprF family membrane protein
MKKLRFYIALFIFLLTAATNLYAQDIHVSQFYETPLMRNPALAGIFTGHVRLQAVHRTQWSFTGHGYRTTALSGEYKFPVGYGYDFMTVGMQTFYDVAGSSKLKTLQVMPALNFHKALSGSKSEYLSGGFMIGMVQRQFDLSNLTFNNQYNNGQFDPNSSSGENFSSVNRKLFDMAAGLSFSSTVGETGSYYLGASLFHINQPIESFKDDKIQLPSKFQLNGGLHLQMGERVDMVAEMNYSKQGTFREIMLGSIWSLRLNDNYTNTETEEGLDKIAIGAGGFIRLNDAFTPVVKLTYQRMDIGLSYDINLSDLKTGSKGRGGYELSLSYKFTRPSLELSKQFCPRF